MARRRRWGPLRQLRRPRPHPASAVFRSGHAVAEAALAESVFRVSDRTVRVVVTVMDHDTEAVVKVLARMATATEGGSP